MTNSILQSFLDNRFIKTDDPEHITKLEKASAVVQKQLIKNRHSIIVFTLVALDPNISDHEPVIMDVEGIIIKQWPTFRNSVVKTKDKPVSYIQAVILDALSNISKDINLASLIWHTGCKIISYYKISGQEKVLAPFLLEIGNKVEEVSHDTWGVLENVDINTIDPIEIALPKVSQGRVGEAQIKNHLLTSAGHSGWAPTAGGGTNPSPPNNQNWAPFFAEKAAKGLAEEINAALSTQSQAITSSSNGIKESIGSYFTNLKPYLEQISSSIIKSSQSLNKRSDLIWWKHALYSHRLNLSYRTLSPIALAISMAVDLADKVSPIYPKSVDYFLSESLRDVINDSIEKRVTFSNLLNDFQKISDIEKKLLDDFSGEQIEGRQSIGMCILNLTQGNINSKEFFKYTGIDEKAEISLGEFSLWLFHDLQANKLANKR